MKKIYLAALVLLTGFSATRIHAQQGFNVSLKARTQASWLSSSNYLPGADGKFTLRPNLGVGLGYSFNQTSGIETGAYYSFQGQKYNTPSGEFDYDLQYVKVPLMYTFSYPASQKLTFIGKLGPQVSFLTSAKVEDEDGNKLPGEIESQFRNTTWGAASVAGTELRLGKQLYLTSGIRFDYDFSNVLDEDHPSYPVGLNTVHNMTAGFDFGVKYKF